MKQITQTPGGRRYTGNDFLAMQDLTLKLTEGFYSQFGNFIPYGCEVTGGNIAPGIVMLDGKACLFAGAQGITAPYYVKQVVVNENVPYKIGEGLGYQTYMAQVCADDEAGAFRLDNAKDFKKVMTLNSEFTYIVDSDEALAAWAANAPGNDYSSVLVKKGTWTLNGNINLSNTGTKIITGQADNLLVFTGDTAMNAIHYAYYSTSPQAEIKCITGVNIRINYPGGCGFFCCYNLVDCTAYSLNNNIIHGFANCNVLTRCFGVGSGFGSDYNSSTGNGTVGAGFKDCRILFGCSGTINSGNPTYRDCYMSTMSETNPVANTAEGGWNRS
ncbi:MAG: hypothetical protein LBK94_08720 [Prevotellaceae bacterium]|jgi:hypothetical protein|nr:hypothetical protein [Prevotellaceae bacterium]